MRYHKIPDETIRRLPIYLRGLLFLAEQGQESISSRNLADFLGVNSWQIRKDFSYFGDFGTPGVGYNIEKLVKQVKKILKLNVIQKAALVGVGKLGRVVLAYPGFGIYSFDIAAVLLRTLRRRKIDLAIITVPRDAAQQTTDRLVKAGVRGILNFSPCYITVPKKVKVITIDIAMDLARLPYYMPAG
ncbi:MAG: redox-sensing transcriptional repressor Rex [Planctomycetota bacterium]|jgi:redox-sensing transcriptional repressor